MSDVGVDDLIDELFPERTKKAPPPPSSGGVDATPQHGRRQSEWDDDSDEGDTNKVGNGTSPNAHGGASRSPAHHGGNKAVAAAAVAAVAHTGGRSFDDSSSDDEGDVNAHTAPENGKRGGSGDAARRTSASSAATTDTSGSQRDVPSLRRGMSCPVLHPVPFPSLADSEGAFSCAPRCYLTNRGAALRSAEGHPSLSQLRDLAANERAIAGCPRAQAMLKKGAFHAAAPLMGNGCLDHHGDCTSDGGCPHVLCRKCNYMVVRLQGAAWDDGDGKVNLYLTLRNYYPDWCRLASATPVGVEDGQSAASRLVLKVDAAAAAYCCQCSWLTVRSAKAVIETKLTDAFLVKATADGSHPFATELPLVAGEKRRPPLWVCHGHPHK